MSFNDLDLIAWQALDPAARERVAREIARRCDAELAEVSGQRACGGDGHFWAWLTVATAAQVVHPDILEWDRSGVNGIELRPAIPLD